MRLWKRLMRRKALTDGQGNVLAWAYGDGRHDDYENFQRAVDAAAERGSAIHVPAGRFKVHALPSSHSTLIGANSHDTLVSWEGAESSRSRSS